VLCLWSTFWRRWRCSGHSLRSRSYGSCGGPRDAPGVELTLETVEAEHLFGDIPALAGRLWDVYTETLDPSRVAILTISLHPR
jgi:hypothetical protein